MSIVDPSPLINKDIKTTYNVHQGVFFVDEMYLYKRYSAPGKITLAVSEHKQLTINFLFEIIMARSSYVTA